MNKNDLSLPCRGRGRMLAAGLAQGPDGAYLLGVGELRAAEWSAAAAPEERGARGRVRMAGRGGCWKPFLAFRQAFLLEHFLGGERGKVSSPHWGPHQNPTRARPPARSDPLSPARGGSSGGDTGM